jgi:hypothetical protein
MKIANSAQRRYTESPAENFGFDVDPASVEVPPIVTYVDHWGNEWHDFEGQLLANIYVEGDTDDGTTEVSPGLSLLTRWTVKLDDPHAPPFLLHVEVLDGRPVCMGIEVFPRKGQPITAEDYRKVKVAETLRESIPYAVVGPDGRPMSHSHVVRHNVSSKQAARGMAPTKESLATFRAEDEADWAETVGGVVEAVRETRQEQRPKTNRVTDEELEEVVAVYREAATSEDPTVRRKPTQVVADRLHMSRSRAAKRVQMARERDLLPPTTMGKAGVDG